MTVRLLRSIQDIDALQWNALSGVHPLVRHEFLAALEQHHCVQPANGWTPSHLLLTDDLGTPLGAAPLYVRTDSWGEFVFDQAWADAHERLGHPYYPKLSCAIPFTPACGPRLLCTAAPVKLQLAAALRNLAHTHAFSSAHILFGDTTDCSALLQNEFILRQHCQFHWHNRGYQCFSDFTAQFRADKRKKLQRERRRIHEAGIHFLTLHGADMTRDLWSTVFEFSADTFARHGHAHYLNVACFVAIAQALPQHVMVKLALQQYTPVAAAVFFVSDDTLYGRYWGSHHNFHSLHFETCYYQGIEYCIEHQLQHFEPGTQGEHKVPRGFEPTLVWSAHYITEPRLRQAIRQHTRLESAAIAQYAHSMQQHLPFHRDACATDSTAPTYPL